MLSSKTEYWDKPFVLLCMWNSLLSFCTIQSFSAPSPHYLYLRWSSRIPRWLVSLQESALGQVTGSLSRSRFSTRLLEKIHDKVDEKFHIVFWNISDLQQTSNMVRGQNNRSNYDKRKKKTKTKQWNLGVQVISLRGLRQIGQVALTRR